MGQSKNHVKLNGQVFGFEVIVKSGMLTFEPNLDTDFGEIFIKTTSGHRFAQLFYQADDRDVKPVSSNYLLSNKGDEEKVKLIQKLAFAGELSTLGKHFARKGILYDIIFDEPIVMRASTTMTRRDGTIIEKGDIIMSPEDPTSPLLRDSYTDVVMFVPDRYLEAQRINGVKLPMGEAGVLAEATGLFNYRDAKLKPEFKDLAIFNEAVEADVLKNARRMLSQLYQAGSFIPASAYDPDLVDSTEIEEDEVEEEATPVVETKVQNQKFNKKHGKR